MTACGDVSGMMVNGLGYNYPQISLSHNVERPAEMSSNIKGVYHNLSVVIFAIVS